MKSFLSKAAPDCNWGGTLKSIEATDDATVVFTMCSPDPAFPSKAAFASLGIHSAAQLAATGGKPLEAALGTGPYMVKEWVRGDHLTLVPNPNYWGDKPKTGTVIFKWNKESAARLTSLQAGEVDGIDNPAPNDFKTIEADATLKLYPRVALNVMYLGLNNTKPPFDNEMVRQAIAQGINRQVIIDKFYPVGSSVADYFTPCAIPGGCEGEAWYKFDATAAKALLTKAGFPNGFKTTLSYRDVVRGYLPAPGKVAEELQAQLKKNLGIDVTIDVQESGTFLDNSSKGNLSMYMLGWGADYPDMTNFVDYHFGKGASDQFGKKFDDLTGVLAQAASLADQAARNKLYATANGLIKQHVPMIPVAHGGSGAAFKATVAGAYSDPLAGEQFRLMSIPGQDQIVWSQNAEPLSLYCADESDGETLRACEQIFDALLSYEPGGTAVKPGLATGCTSSADLMVWTCALRAGAKFSDGTAVTANDVVATYGVQWDAADPLHVGRDGNFDYWSAFFGGFLPKK
jgi:ABC-type transport system substrate-binding protein